MKGNIISNKLLKKGEELSLHCHWWLLWTKILPLHGVSSDQGLAKSLIKNSEYPVAICVVRIG